MFKVILTYIFDKLWPPFLALLIAQWLTQKAFEARRPKLEMVPEGVKPGTWGGKETYHMWRINVQHVKIPWYFSWIKFRDAAIQCTASLTFHNSNDDIKMQGRWVNTLEIAHVSHKLEKIIYPDAISIAYHSPPEPLDCIVRFDNEEAAYGWNNEAYLTNGRNPRTKLEKGTYNVTVRLSGQNFEDVVAKFKIVVAEDWQKTSLTAA